MIVFQTRHIKVYNYIIHNFLKIEVFNNNTDIGDIIEEILPKYLYREQYQKCVKILEELYNWSDDSFYHNMKAFHEFILYKFMEYMENVEKCLPNFRDIYFDDTSKLLIEKAGLKDFEEDKDDFSLEECIEYFYEIDSYSDVLFNDLDFLSIAELYNNRKLGNTYLEDYFGINIDYYFELLPLDIQEQYKTKHITLTSEISSFINYFNRRVKYGNLYKLFWNNDEAVREERIQLIFENIMDAYFYDQEIEITREALLGNGEVDFKVYKNSNDSEKVLIEIKKASNPYLKKGYEKQLVDYMLSSKYKNAFYLIACFTDQEYDKAINFIRKYVYTDNEVLYINIHILDFRKRKTASVL